MTDPWSNLQKGDVSADAPPDLQKVAFTDTGAYGVNIIGYHMSLELPRMCFKCGATGVAGEVALKANVRPDRWNKLEAVIAGRPYFEKLPSGKLLLKFPYCVDCKKRHTLAGRLRIASYIAPLVFIGSLVAVSGIPSLRAPVLLGLIAGWIGLLVVKRSTTSKSQLRLEGFDSDGIVRISGVDYETAQAVVKTATDA